MASSCCCRRVRVRLRDGIENRYLLDADETIVLVIDYYYIISALVQYGIIKNIDAEHYDAFAYVKGHNIYYERVAFSAENMREPNFLTTLAKQVIGDANFHNKYAPTIDAIVDLFEWLMQNEFVKELIAEIIELKDYIVDLWTCNKTFIKDEFRALARIPFPRAANYYFYLSSPRINMVRSFPDLQSHSSLFIIAIPPSEHIAALILHELMHTVLPTNDNIAHAIIELIADFTFAERFASRDSDSSSTTTDESSSVQAIRGHRHLDTMRDKIRPYWKKYLKNTEQNVFTFYKEMLARFR